MRDIFVTSELILQRKKSIWVEINHLIVTKLFAEALAPSSELNSYLHK